MRKSVSVLIGVFAFFIVACNSNNSGPKITFSGVTETDNFGTVTGNKDTTDWRLDDTWQEKEASLFKESFTNGCLDSLKKKKYRVMFYPNPARQKASLYVVKDSGVRFAYRLVDKDFNVIMSEDAYYGSRLSIDVTSFTEDDTIRIYYKFITSDKCEIRGHGDIFVMPYK